MPFQISLSHYKRGPGIIYSFDAGENKNAICGTINITLTARVNGDLFNHTLWWEQVSGNPVNWLSPRDQLTVDVSYPASDDKVFRFYIDKGTSREQYADVTIYGTPTSIYNGEINGKVQQKVFGDKKYEIFYLGGNDNLLSDNDIYYILGAGIPTSQVVYCAKTTNEFTLVFNLPSNTDGLTKAIIETRDETDGSWIEYQVIQRENLKQNDNTVNIYNRGWFRIILEYKRAMNTYAYITSLPIYLIYDVPRIDAHDFYNGEINGKVKANLNNYDVQIFTLKIFNNDFAYSSTYSGHINNSNKAVLSGYDVIVRTLKIFNNNFTYTSTYNGNIYNHAKPQILNYTVIARDGSQIGG